MSRCLREQGQRESAQGAIESSELRDHRTSEETRRALASTASMREAASSLSACVLSPSSADSRCCSSNSFFSYGACTQGSRSEARLASTVRQRGCSSSSTQINDELMSPMMGWRQLRAK